MPRETRHKPSFPAYHPCKGCEFVQDPDDRNPDSGDPCCKLDKVRPRNYSHALKLRNKGGLGNICHKTPWYDTMKKRIAHDSVIAEPSVTN